MRKIIKKASLILVLCLGVFLFACSDAPKNPNIDNPGDITEEKTLESISLSGGKKEFKVGDTFEKGDLKVTAKYSDNTEEDVTSKATVSTPDMTTAGEKEITVTYNGKEAKYKINVRSESSEKTLESISISGGNKTFIVGDTFEKGDLKVTAKYSDNTEEDVTSKATVSTPDMTTAGEKEITVTYNGKETKYKIKVSLSFEQALESLKGNVEFTGNYILKYNINELEDVAHDISTIFEDDKILMLESDSQTNQVYYEYLYKNVDNKLALLQRNMQNEVNFIKSSADFDEYDNPFNNITIEDFTWVEDNMFEISDAALRKEIASCLTGWNESILVMFFYVEDNKVTRIEFTTETIKIDDAGEYSYISDYEFNVLNHKTATIDEKYYTPFVKTKDHEILENALKNIEPNYTILHYDHEDGYEDLEYNVYVTDMAVYSACLGWENGYVELEGLIYPFNYDVASSKAKLLDPISNYETFREALANFNCFKVEVLNYEGDGIFSSYDANIASEILTNFGEGRDEKMHYSSATAIEIEIRDEKLYQVRFIYNIYGTVGYVELTYSNFGETIMPISFENADKTSVLDEYYGIYVGSNKTIEINKNGIFVNGIVFVVENYNSEYQMFTGTLNGELYYINRLSSKQLVLSNEAADEVHVLTIHDETILELPEEYKGVWEDESNTFIVQSHVIYLNGSVTEIISYKESEGIVCLFDNITYNLFLANGAMIVLVVDANGNITKRDLNKASNNIGIEIPLEYVGIYSYYDETTMETLQIEIKLYEIKMFNVVATIVSYSEEDGFNLSVNGVTYTISFGQTIDTLLVNQDTDSKVYQRINDIKDSYVGKYISVVAERNYEIEITKTSIILNGKEYKQFRLDSEYGYTIEVDNISTYILLYMPNYIMVYDNIELEVICQKIDYTIPKAFIGTWESSDTYTQVVINSFTIKVNGVRLENLVITNNSITGKLGKVEGYELAFGFTQDYMYVGTEENNAIVYKKTSGENPNPLPSDIEIPEKFIGTYKNEEKAYTIVITAEKITVNGIEVEITEYDEYEGFTIELNGTTHYIMQDGYDDEVTGIWIIASDNSYVILTKVSDDSPQPSDIVIPSNFIGTYENDNYTIVITEDEVTINGTKVEVTEADDYQGLTVIYGETNDTYYIYQYGYDSVITKICFASEDNSVFETLTKTSGSDEPGEVNIPQDLVGTYTGTKDEVTYTVVITTNSITINDEAVTDIEVINYFGVSLSFTYNSNIYGLVPTDEGMEWTDEVGNTFTTLTKQDD